MGDQADRGAVDHPPAHDRRDPDRDDERPPPGPARPAARRGGPMSQEPVREPVLTLDHLSLSFGGLRALSELDLQVGDREIVSAIGPNGPGKTTPLNPITAVYQPNSGDVQFGGASIAGRPQHVITRLGIAPTVHSLLLS